MTSLFLSPSRAVFSVIGGCAPLFLFVQPGAAQQSKVPVSFAQPAYSAAVKAPSARAAAAALVGDARSLTSFQSSSDRLGAGLRLSHIAADMKVDLPTPMGSRLKLVANLGVGAFELRANKYWGEIVPQEDLKGLYVSLRGGVNLEYEVAHNCQAFIGAQQYLHFDEQALALQQLSGATSLDEATWSFPVTLGVRFSF